jgi:hypothetical protein
MERSAGEAVSPGWFISFAFLCAGVKWMKDFSVSAFMVGESRTQCPYYKRHAVTYQSQQISPNRVEPPPIVDHCYWCSHEDSTVSKRQATTMSNIRLHCGGYPTQGKCSPFFQTTKTENG